MWKLKQIWSKYEANICVLVHSKKYKWVWKDVFARLRTFEGTIVGSNLGFLTPAVEMNVWILLKLPPWDLDKQKLAEIHIEVIEEWQFTCGCLCAVWWLRVLKSIVSGVTPLMQEQQQSKKFSKHERLKIHWTVRWTIIDNEQTWFARCNNIKFVAVEEFSSKRCLLHVGLWSQKTGYLQRSRHQSFVPADFNLDFNWSSVSISKRTWAVPILLVSLSWVSRNPSPLFSRMPTMQCAWNLIQSLFLGQFHGGLSNFFGHRFNAKTDTVLQCIRGTEVYRNIVSDQNCGL